MIVGSGLVDARASKFTTDPTLTNSESESMLALGSPGPIPEQPAIACVRRRRVAISDGRFWISAIDSVQYFHPIGMLGENAANHGIGIVDGAGCLGSGMVSGMLSGKRVLGFDLETTGFNHRVDRIVQYALVGSDGDGSHIRMQSLVDPGIDIPSDASKVHGISNSDVKGKGEWKKHLEGVYELIEGSVLVGHNVIDFDWRFLEMECLRIGVEAPTPLAILDTLVISRSFQIPGRHRLVDLCDRFGIAVESFHDAQSDAGATMLLLWRIMTTYPDRFDCEIEDFLSCL